MDPDAAGFDLEDDSYKAAKVHKSIPPCWKTQRVARWEGISNVIKELPRPHWTLAG